VPQPGRIHRARRHDGKAEPGDHERLEIANGIDLMHRVVGNAAGHQRLAAQLGRVAAGVVQEPRLPDEFDIQVEATLLYELIIGAYDEVE